MWNRNEDREPIKKGVRHALAIIISSLMPVIHEKKNRAMEAMNNLGISIQLLYHARNTEIKLG